ncbi:MAG TPA: WD40 repeat domain-containing protein [Solirubrobacteraceae bacterium]|nr:WD40 repeat domain-containing protein [Solirubrobacteraceae bacterium]
MTEPRHLLITVGVSEYDRLGEGDQLPSAADDVRIVTELFCGDLRYTRELQDLAVSPRAGTVRERLSSWLLAADRQESDRVTIYWSGHGETGPDRRHYLLGRGFDGHNFLAHALATEELGRMLAGSRVRHLLLLLDTCYAGEGISDLGALQHALEASRPQAEDMRSAIYLVAASRPREVAREGAFSRMLVDAVNAQRHGGWRQAFLDPLLVVGGINERMEKERTGHRAVINVIGSGGGLSPLLPNPRHDERLPDGIEIEAGRRLLSQPDLLAHWGPRARGVTLQSEAGDFFEGRVEALRAIVAWLEAEDSTSTQRVVTGGPGSGKSAVLARLAVLSDAEARDSVDVGRAQAGTLPPIGAVEVAIHARGKTVADVTAEVAEAFDADPVVAMIAEAAATRRRPPVVLVDALDEALDPRGLARELLRPLAESRSVKLVVGTRTHVIPALGAAADEIIDLDDRSRWLDPSDVERYVDRLLEAVTLNRRRSPYAETPELRRKVARQVALRAQGTFLIARLVARSLAERQTVVDDSDDRWIARLPRTVGEAFDEWLDRFGPDKQRVRDLLRPLAFANGGGLPWENIWPPIAAAISGSGYGDTDIEWLLEVAGAFVVETRQADRSAYRLFHEALAEHLRPADRVASIQQRIAVVLTETVPMADGTRAWSAASDYVRTHLATHAADGGVLESLIEDLGYLVSADPTRLLRALAAATADVDPEVRRVYSSAFHMLEGASASERASYVELYAHRHQADRLATRIADRFPNRPWHVTWASFLADSEHFVAGRHDGWVSCVATDVINGRAIAVSGGSDRAVRLWDLDARAPIGRPLLPPDAETAGTGLAHTRRIRVVGATELAGLTVIVVVTGRGEIQVWDWETGRLLGIPLATEQGQDRGPVDISRLGVLVLDRFFEEGTTFRRLIRTSVSELVDVDELQPLLETTLETKSRSHVQRTRDFAGFLRCGDARFLVGGKDNHPNRVCDLETGRPLGEELPATIRAGEVAGGRMDGRPVVAYVVEKSVAVCDAISGKILVEPLECGVGALEVVTYGEVEGTPVAVVAGTDRALRVVDLTAPAPIGGPLVGHTSRVTSLALGRLEGRPVIISGSDDGTVRVWDLRAGLHTTPAPPGYPGPVRSVAVVETPDDGTVVASIGRDGRLQLRALDTGESLGDPVELPGSPETVTVHPVEGRLLVAVGMATGLQTHELADGQLRSAAVSSREGPCRRVQCASVAGALAVVASHDCGLRLWDAGSGTETRMHGAHHEGGVSALAVTSLHGRPTAITGGGEGSLVVWDLLDGSPVATLKGHARVVTAVALEDLDGVVVAVSAGIDGTTRIWDLDSEREAGRLIGHTDWVRTLAFGRLAGGPVVVSGGDDYTLRVWSPTGAPKFAITIGSPVRALAIHRATAVVGTDAGLVALELDDRYTST